MNFLYKQYLPIIIMVIIALCVLITKNNKKFFTWVEDHWFFRRSIQHKISTYCYLIGCSLLLLALMDLRGPEELITGKTSDQKTIILVDSSASMLAEDVRPNRFNKALLLVKHYVRKAVGQKISLLVFSDGHKKIVPFTDDYNLIDARIDTLKSINLSRGGTGLSLALKESIQYLTTSSGKKEGNILIFTDAEETEGGIELDIPDDISVAIIGIGTSKGAPIPIRNNRGVFKGNKKFEGKVVISKLDNKFLESLKKKIKNYRYWVATSYSLPTEEIISFFSGIHDTKNSENDFRVRPVLSSYLMIPGVIFLGLSFIFGRRKTFILISLLMFSFVSFSQPMNLNNSSMPPANEEEKEPVKSDKTLRMEEQFVNGKLSHNGKKALAVELLKDQFPADSASLYEEILDGKINETNKTHHFNHATALIKNKKVAKAINKYKTLLDYLEANESEENNKIADKTKLNILKALQSGGQGSSKSKDKEESDSDDKNNSEGESKDQKKSDKKSKEDEKDKEGKNSKDKKDDKNKDPGDKDKKKKKNKKESAEEKKERKKKLPALLKQLLSDDNKLQKKMIDAKTTERKNRERKDW